MNRLPFHPDYRSPSSLASMPWYVLQLPDSICHSAVLFLSHNIILLLHFHFNSLFFLSLPPSFSLSAFLFFLLLLISFHSAALMVGGVVVLTMSCNTDISVQRCDDLRGWVGYIGLIIGVIVFTIEYPRSKRKRGRLTFLLKGRLNPKERVPCTDTETQRARFGGNTQRT